MRRWGRLLLSLTSSYQECLPPLPFRGCIIDGYKGKRKRGRYALPRSRPWKRYIFKAFVTITRYIAQNVTSYNIRYNFYKVISLLSRYFSRYFESLLGWVASHRAQNTIFTCRWKNWDSRCWGKSIIFVRFATIKTRIFIVKVTSNDRKFLPLQLQLPLHFCNVTKITFWDQKSRFLE